MTPQTELEIKEFLARVEEELKTKINSIVRDAYVAIGRVEAVAAVQLDSAQQIRALAEKEARHDQQIIGLRRTIYGDPETVYAPSVRKDLDRHDQEIQDIREILTTLVDRKDDQSDKLTEILNIVQKQNTDMRFWMATGKIVTRSIPFVTERIKDFVSTRWGKIMLGVFSPIVIAALYELARLAGILP